MLFVLSSTVQADLKSVDLNDFMAETQKMSESHDSMKMVWWLPTEYWEIVGENDPAMTDAIIKDVTDLVQKYLVVAVVDGVISPFGSISYESAEKIRTGVSLKDSEGTVYFPLADTELDPDLKILFQSMKPVFEAMLGEMGSNFHFFAFENKSIKGQSLAQATEKGGFSLGFSGETFEWSLPLSSLVKKKICPVDSKKVNGTWIYCPWHGKKLTD